MARLKNVVEKSNKIAGGIDPKYDMSFKNLEEIWNAHTNAFDAIYCSFRFGYLQGMKATKAEMKK